MKPLPSNVKKYKETPTFSETNIPEAMMNAHSTKKGVWGLIVLEEGELEYCILPTSERHVLNPKQFGVVEPEVKHQVRPLGPVQFRVEFYQSDNGDN